MTSRKRTVLDSGSKVQRIAVRKDLGKLKDLVVSPSTNKRYSQAVQTWLHYLSQTNANLATHCRALDEQLCDYLQYLWENGEGKALAANTLAGLQHFLPQVKYRLPCAWRLYKAWNTRELPARAAPLTEELVKALSGQAFLRNRPDVAVALQVGFAGLLRTGELLAIMRSSCEFKAGDGAVVLNLGLTKSGQRMGALESVGIEKKEVVKMLHASLLASQPGDLLLPRGPHDFRSMFQTLLSDLGLQNFGFKPYSLRRGGATADFRSHGQLSKTVVRGRWSNARTARVYINEGLALIASFRFDEQQKQIAEALKVFHSRTSLARE